MTAEQWVTLIEQRAPALRTAGVVSISFDGCAVTLAPAAPTMPVGDTNTSQTDNDNGGDPLNNPALYPDGVVPGYVLRPDDAP